jgi:hypothetical protein
MTPEERMKAVQSYKLGSDYGPPRKVSPEEPKKFVKNLAAYKRRCRKDYLKHQIRAAIEATDACTKLFYRWAKRIK